MFTTALAATSAFEVVLFSKHNIPLLGVVVVSFLTGYVLVFVHHQQNNEIVR